MITLRYETQGTFTGCAVTTSFLSRHKTTYKVKPPVSLFPLAPGAHHPASFSSKVITKDKALHEVEYFHSENCKMGRRQKAVRI